MLAVAALALSSSRGGEPAPPASPSPTPVAPVADAPLQTFTPAETDPPSLPVTGPAATGLRGRVVVVEAGRPSVLDLASGKRTALGEVASPVRHAVTVGSSVVLSGAEGDTGDFPPLPGSVWVVGPDLRVRRLPDAGTVTPDAAGTGVWLTTWLPDGSGGTMRRVMLDGRVTDERFELPGPFTVVGATGGGIVLTGLVDDAVEVWDPARDRLVHREPGMGYAASAPSRLLWWFDHCVKPCLIFRRDMPNAFDDESFEGRGTVLVPPEPRLAELSPDGRRVVTQSVGQRVAVAVCDIDPERCQELRNLRITEFAETAWSVDGETLLIALPAGVGQLAAWRPWWGEARPVPGEFRAESIAALGT
ncbi:MAG TPA: hypothetical protein VNA20_09950 [Frankiaceae bacterium]|nr:hypothetical protein [Frankiaceae bacterium]